MRRKPWAAWITLILSTFGLVATAGAQLGPFSATFWSADSSGVVLSPDEGAAFGRALAAGDFDCDGLDDLAIGIPFQDFFVDDDSGAVLVLYGRLGLGPTPDRLDVFRQNSITSDGIQADDHFGLVLAAGDFDSDDCSDLVIGTPNEDIDDRVDSGAVFVIYGGSEGLGAHGSDFWQTTALGQTPAADDELGAALATGDFDDDGWMDLAIGAPGRLVAGQHDAGMVYILFGSAAGLDGDVVRVFNEPIAADQFFGQSLASGDFLSTDGDELAVGVPRLDLLGANQAGGVVVLSGIGQGPISRTLIHENSPGVPGVAEPDDQFGTSLAAGDFNGNGRDELAIGTPQESPELKRLTKGGLFAVGAVTIVDLDGDKHQHWTQDQLDPELGESGDAFGHSLVAADFDGNGTDDLAIGAFGEDQHGAPDSGVVHVLYGTLGLGLTSVSNQIWAQTADAPEPTDAFGFALAAADFDGVGAADLAAGAPLESLDTEDFAGAVSVWFSNLPIFDDGFESGDTSSWSIVVP